MSTTSEIRNINKELGLARLDPYLELQVSMEIIHAELDGQVIDWNEIRLRFEVEEKHERFLAQLKTGRDALLRKVAGQPSNDRVWHAVGIGAARCRTKNCARDHYATPEEVVASLFAQALAGNEDLALGLCDFGRPA